MVALLRACGHPDPRDARIGPDKHVAPAADIAALLRAHPKRLARAQDARGVSALMWAVSSNATRIVAQLIAAGAPVDKEVGNTGITALHLAAEDGHDAIASQLIAAGASVNKTATENGSTPLHIAAWNGRTATAALLLEKGADVHSEDDVSGCGKDVWVP